MTRKEGGDVRYDDAGVAVGLVLLVAVASAHWRVDRDGTNLSRTAFGTTMIELYEQQVAETRRANAVLEKIAAALDKRSHG